LSPLYNGNVPHRLNRSVSKTNQRRVFG
jgi:hypothetical protein